MTHQPKTAEDRAFEMTERPILFSAPMVRAIIEGRKTQTRRVLRPQPSQMPPIEECSWVKKYKHKVWWPSNAVQSMCPIDDLQGIDPAWKGLINHVNPFGEPGDRLWVRETIWLPDNGEQYVSYFSDAPDLGDRSPLWHKVPSIHMPRWASRILLEITDVRVERLQEITTEDVIAEGPNFNGLAPGLDCAVEAFRNLWSSIHASDGPNGWTANPWVWVIKFKEVKK